MAISSYAPQLYVLAENATEPDVIGQPLLSADFDQAMIDVLPDGDQDGQLVIYASNQYNAPDVSQPVSSTNQYQAIGYTDMSDKSYYDTSNPITPTGDQILSVNADYTGSRWLIVAVLNRTAGTVVKLSATLFDNK